MAKANRALQPCQLQNDTTISGREGGNLFRGIKPTLPGSILALLGDFGYSQNGGGTFSDFLIFFSPWLYLLITTSSSLKAAD